VIDVRVNVKGIEGERVKEVEIRHWR